jgi:hypothetical protein
MLYLLLLFKKKKKRKKERNGRNSPVAVSQSRCPIDCDTPGFCHL